MALILTDKLQPTKAVHPVEPGNATVKPLTASVKRSWLSLRVDMLRMDIQMLNNQLQSSYIMDPTKLELLKSIELKTNELHERKKEIEVLDEEYPDASSKQQPQKVKRRPNQPKGVKPRNSGSKGNQKASKKRGSDCNEPEGGRKKKKIDSPQTRIVLSPIKVNNIPMRVQKSIDSNQSNETQYSDDEDLQATRNRRRKRRSRRLDSDDMDAEEGDEKENSSTSGSDEKDTAPKFHQIQPPTRSNRLPVSLSKQNVDKVLAKHSPTINLEDDSDDDCQSSKRGKAKTKTVRRPVLDSTAEEEPVKLSLKRGQRKRADDKNTLDRTVAKNTSSSPSTQAKPSASDVYANAENTNLPKASSQILHNNDPDNSTSSSSASRLRKRSPKSYVDFTSDDKDLQLKLKKKRQTTDKPSTKQIQDHQLSKYVEKNVIPDTILATIKTIWSSRVADKTYSRGRNKGRRKVYEVNCGTNCNDSKAYSFQCLLHFQDHYIAKHTNYDKYKCSFLNCSYGACRKECIVRHIRKDHLHEVKQRKQRTPKPTKSIYAVTAIRSTNVNPAQQESVPRNHNYIRKKTITRYQVGKFRNDNPFKCTFMLVKGTCPKNYATKAALTAHIKQRHQSPNQMADLSLTTAVMNGVKNSQTSIGSYINLRKMIGATLDNLRPEDVSENLDVIKILLKINSNTISKSNCNEPYHACFIVLIDPKFYIKDKSIPDIIHDNFHDPEFEIKVFVDSSASSGPCPFHSRPVMCKHSDVYQWAMLGWNVYTNNIVFSKGPTREDNKQKALHFQQKWKLVSAFTKITGPSVKKVRYLNKTLANKGCTIPLTDTEIIEAMSQACSDEVPDDILNSKKEDWEEYNLKHFVEHNHSLENLYDDDNDPEFMKHPKDISLIEPLLQEKISTILGDTHKRILENQLKTTRKPLKRPMLSALAMINNTNRTISLVDLMIFLKNNFTQLNTEIESPDFNIKKFSISYSKSLTESKYFQLVDNKPGRRKWCIRPNRQSELNLQLNKWATKFGSQIRQEMSKPEYFDTMMRGELSVRRTLDCHQINI